MEVKKQQIKKKKDYRNKQGPQSKKQRELNADNVTEVHSDTVTSWHGSQTAQNQLWTSTKHWKCFGGGKKMNVSLSFISGFISL